MNRPNISLCSAVPIDFGADDAVPEWIQLLPAGQIRTADGRGPYRVTDAVALMRASLSEGDKLVLDENHSTDRAAPRGESAPARGWIVELQERAGGIWGRVDWTSEGRRLMGDKAYRGTSPAIAHLKDGAVTQILRASLTNTPNFVGMESLHTEGKGMNWLEELRKLLGLGEDADDAAVLAALKKKLDGDGGQTALQSALAPIAKAVGLAEGSDAAAVLAGVQQLATGDGGDETVITALQSELKDLGGKFVALQSGNARKDAVAFVDAAIAAGRVGVKPMRDRYIALHMKDAADTEALIGAMPIVKGGATLNTSPTERAAGALSDADSRVIALMGLDPEEYKKTLAAEGQTVEAN